MYILTDCIVIRTYRVFALYSGRRINMNGQIVVVTQRQDSMSPARANAVLSLRYNYFG